MNGSSVADLIRQGVAAHNRGDLGIAETLYRSALEQDPNSADAMHLLGLIAHATGHLEEAADLIRAAISVNPAVAAYHSNLGNIHLSRKQPAAAERCLQQSLALDPDFAAAYNNLGLTYSAQGRFSEAADSFRRAAALQPGLGEAFSNLANALKDQGLLAEAEEAARAAISGQPGDPDHKARLARIVEMQGRHAEAAALAEAALAETPNSAALLLAHGIAMLGLGRPVRATQDFQRAMTMPTQMVEAPDYLREAISRQPGDDEHFARLRSAHESGRIRIEIDTEKLRDSHAPFRVEFYDTRAFILVFGCWVGAFAFLPLWPALATAGTVSLGHWLFGRGYVRRLMHAYALDKVVGSSRVWDQVWQVGAISLRDTVDGGVVDSPKGNWRLLVEDISVGNRVPA
ncbi:tetratricopeptide repeat protein [Magnetospirillum sp. SS-4]|uniref:tetratricopeptide repeat protein n=1 Tax=Magnetospirillum sp. SS-4 TaxID=2681465 RepID=UPI00138194ED|nr:tetratricopeptide repeat protein [Magnetospirillum sp. SS-4]CAA7619876.1 hypothetical protein MTBSS4_260030 [Magnetospirillum sp. SS-4]